MIYKEIDEYEIAVRFANTAIIKSIDETQGIVVCCLAEVLGEKTEILATDRYFYYCGERKNIPFADIAPEEIELLNTQDY
jgi:hypothetical protein